MVHYHKFGTENVFIFQNKTIITIIERMTPLILHYAPSIYTTLCFYIEFIIILKQLLDNNKKKRSLNKTVHYNLNIYTSTHNLLNLDVTFFRFSTRDTPS